MTQKYIPREGEPFVGPEVKKRLHVTYGPDSAADVAVSDCGTYTLVGVKNPIIVERVYAFVETAFDASVAATIGDSVDADRYFAAATLGDTVVDTALQADTLAVPFWDTAGLDIQAVVSGAVPTVGLAHLFIEYSDYEA